MKCLDPAERGKPLYILCLGAHSDDIEIGVGGTILSLIASGIDLHVDWCVLSAGGVRAAEAQSSATDFLAGAKSQRIEIADFDDSFFPSQNRLLKKWLIDLRMRISQPDIVFTHASYDRHQDHREVNQLTWNVFRDEFILEYEIPKWDGDLGQPNGYASLSRDIMDRKVELLMKHFGTQRSKDWFDPETFRGLARLRGMECRAEEHYAEAFTLRKTRLF
ncbi:PIG-L domain-containing protein [Phyllobacterium phragmitis]|uniref:PIG-L domain-containing protein n=1 Tax=Phyllobacterium phragmitis TaxID=2670329 RepID=A0A2S9IMD3_9HYPH|nr:PIG-L deacetylase family protein [Phyllobacterium phragmitis]PRD41693.1 PIG-L domain-containing protein [Phyllobacterium phragmitis]